MNTKKPLTVRGEEKTMDEFSNKSSISELIKIIHENLKLHPERKEDLLCDDVHISLLLDHDGNITETSKGIELRVIIHNYLR